MKKIFICLCLLTFMFLLTGCEFSFSTHRESAVLYFSATGTTKTIAERIAKESDSELIEIIPKEKYKESDLTYNEEDRAMTEQNDENSRPEIENEIDISGYKTIYLGFPIWFNYNPRIIYTLLDKYDFSGKTIIPFCTSGSTGISGSVNDLRNYNNKLNIKDGKRFNINDSDKTTKDFINNNN